MILTKNDIKEHPNSSTTLFYYKGKLYRGIEQDKVDQFKAVASLKYAQPYSETKYKLKWDKELRQVIEHPIIEHMPKVQELTPRQVLKITIGLAEMNVELAKKGLILYDIHEGNISYQQGQLIWLDFNATGIADDNYTSYSFVKLVYLVHKYIFKKNIGGYSTFNNSKLIKQGGWPSNQVKKDKKTVKFWQSVLQWLNNIKLPKKKNHWSDNYSNIMNVKSPEDVNPKAKIVADLLEEIEYKTVTDVACNKGYYTFLAIDRQEGVESAIGFDYVEPCIDLADEFDRSIPATFTCSDIERIIANKYDEIDRYSSELVIALAIVHHITFKHATFAKLLADLTKKYLILEDINTEKEYETHLIRYGLELIKRVSSYPGGRKLSLYRVKSS